MNRSSANGNSCPKFHTLCVFTAPFMKYGVNDISHFIFQMANTTADSYDYTYCNLALFRHHYRSVHGYLSLIVCIFGSIANVLNVCVLRTKEMQSPTNVILIGIAVTDLLLILEYFPFIYDRHLSSEIDYARHYTYSTAVWYRYHSMVSLTLHFISCCLVVVLSIWRYNFLSRLQVQNFCCSRRNTAIVILFIYIMCPLICYPSWAFSSIQKITQLVDEHGRMVLKHNQINNHNKLNMNETIYVVDMQNPELVFWIYGICIKFLPCLLLSIFFYLILSILMRRNQRRQRRKLLFNGNQLMDVNNRNKQENIQIYKENQNDQTTKMLLIILLLFLITQFPLSFIGLISAFYGKTFINECYNNLGKKKIIIDFHFY